MLPFLESAFASSNRWTPCSQSISIVWELGDGEEQDDAKAYVPMLGINGGHLSSSSADVPTFLLRHLTTSTVEPTNICRTHRGLCTFELHFSELRHDLATGPLECLSHGAMAH